MRHKGHIMMINGVPVGKAVASQTSNCLYAGEKGDKVIIDNLQAGATSFTANALTVDRAAWTAFVANVPTQA